LAKPEVFDVIVVYFHQLAINFCALIDVIPFPSAAFVSFGD